MPRRTVPDVIQTAPEPVVEPEVAHVLANAALIVVAEIAEDPPVADTDKPGAASRRDLLALRYIIKNLASAAGDSLSIRQKIAVPALELIDSLLK